MIEFTYDYYMNKLSGFMGMDISYLESIDGDEANWGAARRINFRNPGEGFLYYNRLELLCSYIRWHLKVAEGRRRNLSKKLKGDVLNWGCGLATENLMAAPNINSFLYDVPTLTYRFMRYLVETEKVNNVVFGYKANNKFDTIVCVDVLEHMHNPIEALLLFKSALKPGGRLLIRAPFEIACDPSHIQDHTLNIEDMLHQCDYKKEQYEVVEV